MSTSPDYAMWKNKTKFSNLLKKREKKKKKEKMKPCNLKATMGNKGLARNWLGPFFLEVTV